MAEFNVQTTTTQVIEKFGQNARGKTFVVTGPSPGGLGATAVYALASASPKRLILAGRSASKIQPVIEKVAEINSAVEVTFVRLDLADLSSVRDAATKIKSAAPDGINGLLNNAGVMAPKTYTKTADGVELQFQANHLGHFLLTKLLLPDVAKVKGVITNVTSRSWMLSDPAYDDVNFEDGKTYHGWVAYGRSKLANIHFAIALAKRIEKLGVATYSVHPGLVMESQLASNSGIDTEWFGEGFRIATERSDGNLPEQPLVTLEQGAATPVLTLLDPSLRGSSGKYFEECHVVDDIKEYAKSPENAEKLWEVSEKLTGEKFAP